MTKCEVDTGWQLIACRKVPPEELDKEATWKRYPTNLRMR